MEWVIVGCYVAALILILAEFLIPGGVLGFLGCVLILTSCGFAVAKTDHGLMIVLGELTGAAVAVMCGVYMLAHTRAGRIMVMDGQQKASEGWTSPAEDPALVGAVGEAHSALRPAGAIMVDGRRIDAVSSGEFIEKGVQVRVVEVEGHRVVVESVPGASEASSA